MKSTLNSTLKSTSKARLTATLNIFPDERPKWVRFFLATLPFVLLVIVYGWASNARLKENPQDKLLPDAAQMFEAVDRLALTPDKRSGEYLLWRDTTASLKRLLLGVGIAAVLGCWLGLVMGLFRAADNLLAAFMTTLALIPPLAVLPVLFIVFGLGEMGKVVLIFIGAFPVLTRDVYLTVKQLPKEQIVKAMTLGAHNLAIAYRIVLPQILPRLIQSVRLILGAAWLFLIAAEAIAATEGLGYRIFLVRRYMSMDVILPYVAWITCLGYVMDLLLRGLLRWRFRWYLASQ